ncbi:hypothetical protein [Nitratireductor thuwali]|uniref:Uncharacterized protein n=1 Tax=Nitratireductor thuwali TaxID=2267699 RepID=A0ABY5MSE2_9HYPH|nr:hypothetical protein NTH_04031 [Nitratireductor thuwali]
MIVKQVDGGLWGVFATSESEQPAAGPFETNVEAWRAADRLDGEPVGSGGKRADFITGKALSKGPTPDRSSKKKRKKLRKMKRVAAKAPRWLRSGAAATFDPHGRRKHRDAKLGTFGPASAVRHIDPAEYAGAAGILSGTVTGDSDER